MNRAHTSKRKVKDLRRPDRRTDMKALVSKSYHFAGMLWTEYVARNGVDLRYVYVWKSCVCVPKQSGHWLSY